MSGSTVWTASPTGLSSQPLSHPQLSLAHHSGTCMHELGKGEKGREERGRKKGGERWERREWKTKGLRGEWKGEEQEIGGRKGGKSEG